MAVSNLKLSIWILVGFQIPIWGYVLITAYQP